MNYFNFLNQGVKPDTGADSREYQFFTIYSHSKECVIVRVRKHGKLFSAGYFVSFKNEERQPEELFPSCAVGTFRSEREAKLYALGEIMDRQFQLSQQAKDTIKATIAELRELSIFGDTYNA